MKKTERSNLSVTKIVFVVMTFVMMLAFAMGISFISEAFAFTAEQTKINLQTVLPSHTKIFLTDEEKEYVAGSPVIKAVSLYGSAPIQFQTANGQIKGISISVLERISEITGLHFEYKLYHSGKKALSSGADIFFGIPHNYAPKWMVLSQPFLKSVTILFINSSLQPQNMEDKKYAAVKGSALPEGVNEKNAIYFDTREESLNAVEKGKADYGYGNAYSVAYYTLLHNYKNIVMIPRGKESRAYCVGMLKSDEMLLSIINKAINSLTPEEMQTMILDTTSHIERDVTFDMVMKKYGYELLAVILIVISLLLYSLFFNIRINKKLRLNNKKYEILSNISNEFLYEYDAKADHINLSDKYKELFKNNNGMDESVLKLKNMLRNYDSENCNKIIKIPFEGGHVKIFRTINTAVYNNRGEVNFIIGKLIDISKETAEKEELLAKASVDGLTDIYNAVTTKKLITERLENKDDKKTDVFLIMDVDNFKEINDTYGHLYGDQILRHVGTRLKQTFRKTDIAGRVGGDEFCVYLTDISDTSFVLEKCKQLTSLVQDEVRDIAISLSIGIVLVKGRECYEDIFKKADTALYQAKENGKAQFIIHKNNLA